MTDPTRPPTIAVVFAAPESAEAKVELDPSITIGQLQVAATELAELAREARAGDRIRQANERRSLQTVAQQLQAGRHQ